MPVQNAAAAEIAEQGIAQHDEGHFDAAETLYRQALAIDPEQPTALCYLGLLSIQRDRPEHGAELLRRAVLRDPEYAEAQHHLGTALLRLQRPEEALSQHERALSLAADYTDAICGRATSLRVLGRNDEAIAGYEQALRQAPDHAEAEAGLADALVIAGREREAFVHYRNAASLDARMTAALDRALVGFATRHPREAQIGMQRLNAFMKAFILNQASPRMNRYPGLSSVPFHDPSRFPVTSALEAAFTTIRSEIEGLAAAEYSPELESHLMNHGAWDVFNFYERGRRNETNRTRCPTISRIIDGHDTLRTLAGVQYASRLSPGAHIRAHRGPTNIRMRCHLGIHVPDGDCAIRVGDQTQRWHEGRCLVFDDSFEHEAWNRTEDHRIVLIVDVWHPDLTPVEIAFLEGLHRYGAYQADSLSAYWAAKAESDAKARKLYD